ncbi:uncharacterized protein LOC113351336 [Papaver somniferum]|uniref:uncharacterized protein LOC113351336 n=1 Tax=Papaver somniferum TaxID=3469 RepID=UPI000E7022EF|nr:uncharacterized protein LOC113351336 [Papaver somniferum]
MVETDGMMKKKGIGGVVRDDDGSFVAGFAKHIYQNGCNMTEVWEVRNGLQTVIQPGIKKLEVDCDSTFAIQLCRGEVQAPWHLRGLIQDIEVMKMKFEDIVFEQQYKEANFMDDTLAKKASERNLEGIWIDIPPDEIINKLVDDIHGVSYPRIVRIS